MQSLASSRTCAQSKSIIANQTGAESAPQPQARALAAGLVHSQTSDTPTPTPGKIPVNPEKTRLKRLQSSVLTAARLHCSSKPKWRVVMVTPTYAPGSAWNPRDITNLTKCVRQWLARRGLEFRYVWVMEYTKKGFPHYHMLVWLPLGITLPYADKRGWWNKGWTNQEWARNAVGYIAKYASKGTDQKRITSARHHGNGGMTGEAQLEQRWWKLPQWLRESVAPADGVKRIPKLGYLSPGTGEVFRSPWEVIFEHGSIYIKLKEVTA